MDADGDFVIVWESLGQDGSFDGVYARRYTNDGAPLDAAEFRVNTYTTDRQELPSVAIDTDGDFVVAWESEDQDGDLSGVFARQQVFWLSYNFTPVMLKDQ